jgi:hypothetical protein
MKGLNMSNRRARPFIAAAIAGLLGATLGAVPAIAADAAPLFGQPPAGTTNFTGKWMIVNPPKKLTTSDGKAPPLNAAGQALLAKRQAAVAKGDKTADPVNACLMHGIPRLIYAPYPFLILQTSTNVNFVHEVNHTFRNVYWNAKLDDDADPLWLGNSSAHIDGKTLIIDSVGFLDTTWLDYSGLPHGEKMKTQERYTLNGDTIDGTVAITDPEFYTAPWTVKFTLKRQQGMALKENVCKDTHQM